MALLTESTPRMTRRSRQAGIVGSKSSSSRNTSRSRSKTPTTRSRSKTPTTRSRSKTEGTTEKGNKSTKKSPLVDVKKLVVPSSSRTMFAFRAYVVLGILLVWVFLYSLNYHDKLKTSGLLSDIDLKMLVRESDPYTAGPQWLVSRETWYLYVIFTAMTMSFWYASFVSLPSFPKARLIYAVFSVPLLIIKIRNFWKNNQICCKYEAHLEQSELNLLCLFLVLIQP